MRVVQLLPTLSFGDAIGNDTIALKGVISEMGYSTDIYAENIDKRLPEGIAQKADKLRDLFAIPENEAILAVIALGYRSEEPNMPVHRPLDEVVKFF